MISGIVLTKNEEENIAGCLESLSWCDQVIIIDDYSTDKTRAIAREMGAEVYKRHLKGDFSRQRNFGLAKARGDWVLFVDADERVTDQLKKEIVDRLADVSTSKDRVGFRLKRKDKFLDSWLSFGETGWTSFVRLARRGRGEWQGRVHEVWLVKGRVDCLENPLIHQRQLTIREFIKRLNFYSSLRAKELYQKGVKTNWLLIIAYPAGKFLVNYFLKLGLLDGQPGLIMAVMMSLHSFLVRAKLYLLWEHEGVEEPPPLPLEELYERYG